jgi:hypothetical protein
MKLFYYSLLVSALVISGCEKSASTDEGNPVELKYLTYNLEIVHGNNQQGEYNKLLSDSLVVKVVDDDGNPVAGVSVSFIVRTGESDISPDWIITDSLGIATAHWMIGCYSDFNEVVAYLKDPGSNLIDSALFTARASLPDGWGKSCGVAHTSLYETVIREYNGTIYLTDYDKIYSSQDGGVTWQEFEDMPPSSSFSNVFDVQFNSKGWMYIVTEYDGVFYSKDSETWAQINNGIADHGYPNTFLLEDTCMFLSFNYDGLYRTTNNGEFWEQLPIKGKLLRRHPNGDLYVFKDSYSLYKSVDNGSTWENTGLSYKYISYGVEQFDIGKNGNLYIGSDEATISIVSPDTYQCEEYSYPGIDNNSQYISDVKLFHDVLYYSVNGGETPGIYSNKNWSRVAEGCDQVIYSFYLKEDGTFLVTSENGVYYYIKK